MASFTRRTNGLSPNHDLSGLLDEVAGLMRLQVRRTATLWWQDVDEIRSAGRRMSTFHLAINVAAILVLSAALPAKAQFRHSPHCGIPSCTTSALACTSRPVRSRRVAWPGLFGAEAPKGVIVSSVPAVSFSPPAIALVPLPSSSAEIRRELEAAIADAVRDYRRSTIHVEASHFSTPLRCARRRVELRWRHASW